MATKKKATKKKLLKGAGTASKVNVANMEKQALARRKAKAAQLKKKKTKTTKY